MRAVSPAVDAAGRLAIISDALPFLVAFFATPARLAPLTADISRLSNDAPLASASVTQDGRLPWRAIQTCSGFAGF